MSHGRFGRVTAAWDSGGGTDLAVPKARPAPVPAPPRRVPSLDSEGLLPALWHRITSVVSSVESLVFFVMFLAFLGFAVHWVLLMIGAG